MTEIGELVAILIDMAKSEPVEEKEYELEWSRQHVIPDNVLKTGDVEVRLKLKVTKGSLTGPDANLVILSANEGPALSGGSLPEVKVNGAKLVGAGGKDATFRFEVKHAIWKKFDKLEYHFACFIDELRRRTTKTLKVKRWHVQAIDINPAEAGKQLPFRFQEQAQFNAAFAGRPDDDKKSHSFVAHAASFADFASWMKNTYSFVYTGHGLVICRACGQRFLSIKGTTDAEFGTWKYCSIGMNHRGAVSTFCIGGYAPAGQLSFFHAAHVRDPNVVKVVPRYLVFSVACGGAFETSLFDSFIARGTRYGVGFEKSTRCDWARDYANSFFTKWVKTHNCDPDKIPDVFDGLLGSWKAKLRRVLFGRVRGLGSHLREFGRKIVAALS